MSKNFLKDMFINEAKPALKRHSGGEGGSATVNVPGGWKGTPVPNTGTVENVYCNTNLSIDEVVKLLEQLDFIEQEPGNPEAPLGYFVYLTADTDSGIVIEKWADDAYDICIWLPDLGGYTLFDTYDDIGWCHQDTPIPNPLTINAEVISVDPVMNAPVGLQNDMLSSILSSTPFTKIEAGKTTLTGEYDGSAIEVTENGNVDIKTFIENRKLPLSVDINVEGSIAVNTPGDWQGTPVPNSGYVENVYFNTNLSIEEVIKIMSQVNLTSDSISGLYFLLERSDFSNDITFAKYSQYCDIKDGNGNTYFSSDPDSGINGWNTELTNPIAINSEVIDHLSVGDRQVGLQNDLISSLFSTTPFNKTEDEKTTLSGEYDGSTVIIYVNELEGTQIPNTGYVENIYINTEMSAEYVTELLSKVLTPEKNIEYILCSKNADGHTETFYASAEYFGENVSYKIFSGFDYDTYFSSDSFYDYGSHIRFTGWHPELTNIVPINKEVADYVNVGSNTHLVGTNNKIFSSILSSTPFKKIYSNEIDLKDYIEEQKLPLKIKIQLPKSD